MRTFKKERNNHIMNINANKKTGDDDISTDGEDVTTEDDISNGENKGTNS